jgi:hypothetical protein
MPSSLKTVLPGALMPKRSMPMTLPAGVPTYFPPEAGDAGFDGDALGAGGGQDAFALYSALWRSKSLEAGQLRRRGLRLAELGGGDHGVLELLNRWLTGWCQRLPVSFLSDVAAFQRAVAAGRPRVSSLMMGRSWRVRMSSVGPSVRRMAAMKGAGGFLGIAGADDVEVRDHAQAADGFHRLVGGAVLTDADGVVGEDVGDGQPGQGGEADARAAQVVGEDEEGGAAAEEPS